MTTPLKPFKSFLLLAEGGKAVSGVVRLNAANLKGTLDALSRVLKRIGIPPNGYAVLGSVGKKAPTDTYGDIDIAIDVPLMFKLGIASTAEDVPEAFTKVLKGLSPDVNWMKGLEVVSCAFPIVNTDGLQPDSFVQVDFMLSDDLNYSQFSYWSPSHEESKYKGAHRNELLLAIAKQVNFKVLETEFKRSTGETIPALYQRSWLDKKAGLMTGLASTKKAVVERSVVTREPIEIVKVLLGPNATLADVTSFETIWDFITKRSDFPYKNKLREIATFAAEGIKRGKFIVPHQLTEYLG